MTLSLTLHAPAGPCPVGRPVPVRAEVRNEGSGELWMVGVVDGSETATRYPVWRPSVRLGDRVVAAPPAAEDPLVGPLRESDFRRLAPGESFDAGRLATFAVFAPAAPGRTSTRSSSRRRARARRHGSGRFNQDLSVLELVARVPRVTVRAQVTVKVA